MIAGLYTKLLGAGLRYFVTFGLLGVGDARAYHLSGAYLSRSFRGFNFTGAAYQEEVPKLVGTPFIKLLTGIVYTISPAAEMSGFMVYSFLGFWGLFLFYKAFRLAVPDGNNRRYALLVFFLPSLVFWPSSIGKEAWMLFTLGIVAYGAARHVHVNRPGGFPIAALGLWATAMVRPHVTLIVFIALAVGYIMRPTNASGSNAAPLRKIVGIGLLIIVGALVVSRTQTFFGVENLDTTTADEIAAGVEEQTSQADSQFSTTRPTNPIQYPGAVVSVLVRPFPWEANSGPAVIAAVEGVLLVVLLCSPKRLRVLPRAFARRPYVAFSVTFAALFVYGFSSIGNFGILGAPAHPGAAVRAGARGPADPDRGAEPGDPPAPGEESQVSRERLNSRRLPFFGSPLAAAYVSGTAALAVATGSFVAAGGGGAGIVPLRGLRGLAMRRSSPYSEP